jgi:hypothetical protein
MREYRTPLLRLSAAARIAVLVAMCGVSCCAGKLARAQESHQTPDANNNKDANAEVKPLDASLHADVRERPKVNEQDTRGAEQQSSTYSHWGFQKPGANHSTVFWQKQSVALDDRESPDNAKNRSIVTNDAFKTEAMPQEHRSWQERATGLKDSASNKEKETNQSQPENRLNRFTLDHNLDHKEDQLLEPWNVSPFPKTKVAPLPQQPPGSTLKPFQEKPFAQFGAFPSVNPFGEYHHTNRQSSAAAKRRKHSLQTKPKGLKPTNPSITLKTTKP